MARKKPDNGPVQVLDGIPPPPEPPELEKTKPVQNWKWSTSKGTVIEVAVWEFETVLDDGQVIKNFTITNHRSYRQEDGSWSTKSGHYRLVDLPTLVFGLQKANEYIMARRDLTQPDF